MKSEFKAKLLQHFLQNKEEKGFTLIELLVVIIIIGILAAIALPSFLNQANKAKQSEAKTYTGSMNRTQQAYYLEKNSFTTAFGDLGLGVATQTTNFQYSINATDPTKDVTNRAKTVAAGVVGNAPFKAYLGGVNVSQVTATSEATTLAILCEGTKATVTGGDNAAANFTFVTTGATPCPANYTSLN